ncbi:MAG: ABC transporter permease [Desulfotalea sp.]
MNYEIIIPLLAATVQSGTPVLFATLGAIVNEKSGVLNLGVEGVMIVGALAGFLTSYSTGSPFLGLVAAGISGLLFASVHGVVCIWFQGNQVVSGLAITILGTGLANYIGTSYVGLKAPGFLDFNLPFLSEIPFFGPIFFQQDILVYLSYVVPIFLWILLNHTRFGLSLRAAGEYPDAARAAGLSVSKYRWAGIWIGGLLMGLGGGYLSLAYTHLWTPNLTGGRGWIAVALVIFAFWRPGRAVFGAYLFGGIMALQLRMQALGNAWPSSLLLMLPYLLTIIVLVMSSARKNVSDAPAALGVNVEPVD